MRARSADDRVCTDAGRLWVGDADRQAGRGSPTAARSPRGEIAAALPPRPGPSVPHPFRPAATPHPACLGNLTPPTLAGATRRARTRRRALTFRGFSTIKSGAHKGKEIPSVKVERPDAQAAEQEAAAVSSQDDIPY